MVGGVLTHLASIAQVLLVGKVRDIVDEETDQHPQLVKDFGKRKQEALKAYTHPEVPSSLSLYNLYVDTQDIYSLSILVPHSVHGKFFWCHRKRRSYSQPE